MVILSCKPGRFNAGDVALPPNGGYGDSAIHCADAAGTDGKRRGLGDCWLVPFLVLVLRMPLFQRCYIEQ